jgi:1-acyl-sn-glycerol-3-phosphate acyltransferase
MARRGLVILGYTVVFWGLVPGSLIALSILGERLFGPVLRLPDLLPLGIMIVASSGFLLALSIVQFTRAAGTLPVSAFPPPRLIRTGVFGVWRHPIYLFFALFFGGLAMIFWPAGSLLLAIPFLTVMTVIYAGIEERGLKRRFGPLYDGHRRQTSIIVPRLVHFVRLVTGGLSRVFLGLEVTGRENAALEPPFIVVSAHRSYLDPFFLLVALGLPLHFITTAEMLRNRLARLVFSKLHCLPATRYKPDVRNALEIRRRLRQGCIVGLFPEAERSWTGSMLGFKPEALRLLRELPGVPILPVRLQGTYAFWPRWAPLPRRTKITVSIGRPLLASDLGSPAEFEAALSGLISPLERPAGRVRPVRAKGIESVLYRCPTCLAFETIRSGRGARFRCSRCQADFLLLSDLSVREPGDDGTSLESLARRCRIGPDSLALAAPAGPYAARGELSVERAGRLEAVGAGEIALTERDLTFGSDRASVRIDLPSVRSVVIEGSRRLQVFGGHPARLYQFAVVGQSALKWQDIIVATVRRHFGASPSTA